MTEIHHPKVVVIGTCMKLAWSLNSVLRLSLNAKETSVCSSGCKNVKIKQAKSLEVGGDVLSCGVDRVETLDMKTEELHRLLEVDRLLLDLHLPLILRESFSYIETPRLIIVLS